MTEKKVELSEACEKALSDLEKIEIQEVDLKDIGGSVIHHLDKSDKTTH